MLATCESEGVFKGGIAGVWVHMLHDMAGKVYQEEC